MTIKDINVGIIQDSRGKDTLEAQMRTGNFLFGKSVKASVPSGKSTGKNEAYVLEPKQALEKFSQIKKPLLNIDFKTQKEFDEALFKLDGTQNKSNLGGNLILALSLAFARLKAKEEGEELFEHLRESGGFVPSGKIFPYPIFNVINGGAHANNNLDFQEFQVIPQVDNFDEALNLAKDFYKKLGNKVNEKFGKENVTLGDEAGYSAPFKSNEEAIEMLFSLIKEGNYPFRIGLDIASTHFFKPQEPENKYLVGDKELNAFQLKEYYSILIDKYNILSIEDPFAEEEFEEFSDFTKGMTQIHPDLLIITDDLTTTNPKLLEKAIYQKAGNAILVKLNQIGSVTETIQVLQMANENNWQAIVSHRSGETLDDFIADLAVGAYAWGIKSGAPNKPERMAKYNRISEILKISK